MVLDLSHLPALPHAEVVRDLFERIRGAGMLPVGLSYGTSENEAWRARSICRCSPNSALRSSVAASRWSQLPSARRRAQLHADASDSPPRAGRDPSRTLHQDDPVRSGQQVYARGGDLVVTKLVANGAEVIADGSIHVYGALRGRALAGAQGDDQRAHLLPGIPRRTGFDRRPVPGIRRSSA